MIESKQVKLCRDEDNKAKGSYNWTAEFHRVAKIKFLEEVKSRTKAHIFTIGRMGWGSDWQGDGDDEVCYECIVIDEITKKLEYCIVNSTGNLTMESIDLSDIQGVKFDKKTTQIIITTNIISDPLFYIGTSNSQSGEVETVIAAIKAARRI